MCSVFSLLFCASSSNCCSSKLHNVLRVSAHYSKRISESMYLDLWLGSTCVEFIWRPLTGAVVVYYFIDLTASGGSGDGKASRMDAQSPTVQGSQNQSQSQQPTGATSVPGAPFMSMPPYQYYYPNPNGIMPNPYMFQVGSLLLSHC